MDQLSQVCQEYVEHEKKAAEFYTSTAYRYDLLAGQYQRHDCHHVRLERDGHQFLTG